VRLISALVVSLTLALASAQFQLPAGADDLLRDPLNEDFDCNDFDPPKYGYYADTNNNCQVGKSVSIID